MGPIDKIRQTLKNVRLSGLAGPQGPAARPSSRSDTYSEAAGGEWADAAGTSARSGPAPKMPAAAPVAPKVLERRIQDLLKILLKGADKNMMGVLKQVLTPVLRNLARHEVDLEAACHAARARLDAAADAHIIANPRPGKVGDRASHYRFNPYTITDDLNESMGIPNPRNAGAAPPRARPAASSWARPPEPQQGRRPSTRAGTDPNSSRRSTPLEDGPRPTKPVLTASEGQSMRQLKRAFAPCERGAIESGAAAAELRLADIGARRQALADLPIDLLSVSEEHLGEATIERGLLDGGILDNATAARLTTLLGDEPMTRSVMGSPAMGERVRRICLAGHIDKQPELHADTLKPERRDEILAARLVVSRLVNSLLKLHRACR